MTPRGIKEYQKNQERQDRLDKSSKDIDLAQKLLEWLQSQKGNTNEQ